MPDQPKVIKLSASIRQPQDISRLSRELESINDQLEQASLKGAASEDKALEPSSKLKELLELNDLELSSSQDRTLLVKWLTLVGLKAPVIHISFSSEASENFLNNITEWFRQNIHPLCLLVIGLEPTIGVGSLVRTTNKVFDFSLRTRLQNNQKLLTLDVKDIKAANG